MKIDNVCARSVPSFLVLIGTALVFCTSAADADLIGVSGSVRGQAMEAQLEESYHSGAQYVSLIELSRQFGGSYSILTSRTRIDLAGSTVWVQYNDRRVNAFQVFSLTRPVLRVGEDVLIATDDVVSFFSSAFGIEVTIGVAPDTVAVPLDDPAVSTVADGRPPRATPDPTPDVTPRQPSQVSPARTRFVIVDPGHGGIDHGIEGVQTVERELTLKAAEVLRAVGAELGLPQLVLTRSADMAVTTEDRMRVAEEARDTVYVSIHVGSSFSQEVRGTAVLYPNDKDSQPRGRSAPNPSQQLAAAISGKLSETTAIPHRGLMGTPLHIASTISAPSVMVEIGCLTNAADEAMLQDPESLRQVMRSVALGIAAYLGTVNESTGTIEP